MRRLARKLNRLPPSQWPALLMAYCWLVRARREMRRLKGTDWLISRQGSICAPSKAREEPKGPDWISQRVRLVKIASRYPFRWSLCLQSSLALQDWLNQGGVYPDLRIGVNKGGGQFIAHAWLELDGQVLNDRPRVSRRFIALNLPDLSATELMRIE